MIDCNGVVRPMPKAAEGSKWRVEKNASNIPYATDDHSKKWCMAFFQEKEVVKPKTMSVAPLPSLTDVDSTPASSAAAVTTPPVPPATPGTPAAAVATPASVKGLEAKTGCLALLFRQ